MRYPATLSNKSKCFTKVVGRFEEELAFFAPKAYMNTSRGRKRRVVLYYTPISLRLCALLDALCFAPCCVTHNAREAIFTGSLASKLADSLSVDYPVQVTNRRLSMTVAVAVAIEEASK